MSRREELKPIMTDQAVAQAYSHFLSQRGDQWMADLSNVGATQFEIASWRDTRTSPLRADTWSNLPLG